MSLIDGTPERPYYEKVIEQPERPTKTYMITCNEGWRESIVCSGMYGWAADWLVDILQGRPYPCTKGPISSDV